MRKARARPAAWSRPHFLGWSNRTARLLDGIRDWTGSKHSTDWLLFALAGLFLANAVYLILDTTISKAGWNPVWIRSAVLTVGAAFGSTIVGVFVAQSAPPIAASILANRTKYTLGFVAVVAILAATGLIRESTSDPVDWNDLSYLYAHVGCPAMLGLLLGFLMRREQGKSISPSMSTKLSIRHRARFLGLAGASLFFYNYWMSTNLDSGAFFAGVAAGVLLHYGQRTSVYFAADRARTRLLELERETERDLDREGVSESERLVMQQAKAFARKEYAAASALHYDHLQDGSPESALIAAAAARKEPNAMKALALVAPELSKPDLDTRTRCGMHLIRMAALIDCGRHDEAYEELTKTLKADPEYPIAILLVPAIFADREFPQEVRGTSQDPMVMLEIVDSARRRALDSPVHVAELVVEACLSTGPALGHIALSLSLAKAGDFESAKLLLEGCVQKDPHHVLPRVAIGRLLAAEVEKRISAAGHGHGGSQHYETKQDLIRSGETHLSVAIRVAGPEEAALADEAKRLIAQLRSLKDQI